MNETEYTTEWLMTAGKKLQIMPIFLRETSARKQGSMLFPLVSSLDFSRRHTDGRFYWRLYRRL